jgi:hypothetical protein
MINSLTNYVNADVLAEIGHEAIDQTREKVDEEVASGEGKNLAEKMISGASAMLDPEKLTQNYLLGFISNMITLSGAILMFRLRKIGFWLYVAGTAVLVATPLIIFGVSNLLSLGLTLGFGIVGILFIVLYSFNLKQLQKIRQDRPGRGFP